MVLDDEVRLDGCIQYNKCSTCKNEWILLIW